MARRKSVISWLWQADASPRQRARGRLLWLGGWRIRDAHKTRSAPGLFGRKRRGRKRRTVTTR